MRPLPLLVCPPDSPGTVYVSKVMSRGHLAVYRFSLNASLPAPWQVVSPGDGEVPSFQVSLGCCEASHHDQGRGPSMPRCRALAMWGGGGRVCDVGAAAGRWGPCPAPGQVCGGALRRGESTGFQVSQSWVRVLALPFLACVPLGR